MHTQTDPAGITDYHLHVYYDPASSDSRECAARLRDWVGTRWAEHPGVRLGRWHEVPVGPHPSAMYQILFPVDLFPLLVPFVMLNRQGLTILLHPESGRPRDDHTLHAAWMGAVLPLNTAVLPESD